MALDYLDLDDNRLTTLPEAIGGLAALEVLHLNGNRLTTLPEEIRGLAALRVLYLNGNHLEIESLPGGLNEAILHGSHYRPITIQQMLATQAKASTPTPEEPKEGASSKLRP